MISKRTQKMLDKRGIKLGRKNPKTITIKKVFCGKYDSFKKSDLEDFGHYEIEDNDWNTVDLFHIFDREETTEEMAKRLCKEHDEKQKIVSENAELEEEEREMYEQLHKKYGNNK